MYIINTIPHGKCFVRYLRTRCFCIRNLTRSLRSLVRFWYVNNSCVNTVRQHFPWSILYLWCSETTGTTHRTYIDSRLTTNYLTFPIRSVESFQHFTPYGLSYNLPMICIIYSAVLGAREERFLDFLEGGDCWSLWRHPSTDSWQADKSVSAHLINAYWQFSQIRTANSVSVA